MKLLSLFAGIGGIDLGFDLAGHETVGQVEWDDHANTILKQHWPGVARWGDIAEVSGSDLPIFDVLAGGFPCQDISVAGHRKGLDGDKSRHWWEFARLIAETTPRWVLVENVSGLLSSNGGRDLGAILSTLEELGYGWAYRTLDAQYFGVAQRRTRVFIIGHLGGTGSSAGQVLFESESGNRDSPPSRGAGEDPAGAPQGGAGGGGEGDLVVHATQDPIVSKDFAPTPSANAYAAVLRMREGKPGGGKGPLISEEKSLTLATANDQVLMSFDELNGEIAEGVHHTMRAGTKQSTGVLAFAQNTRDEVRLLGGNIAGALAAQAGMKQRTYLAGDSILRRLTPRECERLQGFPDGWTAALSDTQRYKTLGNAVAVPVAEWIARRMR